MANRIMIFKYLVFATSMAFLAIAELSNFPSLISDMKKGTNIDYYIFIKTNGKIKFLKINYLINQLIIKFGQIQI